MICIIFFALIAAFIIYAIIVGKIDKAKRIREYNAWLVDAQTDISGFDLKARIARLARMQSQVRAAESDAVVAGDKKSPENPRDFSIFKWIPRPKSPRKSSARTKISRGGKRRGRRGRRY